jgi:hypothetical protein
MLAAAHYSNTPLQQGVPVVIYKSYIRVAKYTLYDITSMTADHALHRARPSIIPRVFKFLNLNLVTTCSAAHFSKYNAYRCSLAFKRPTSLVRILYSSKQVGVI